MRLSRDDEKEGESLSIENQRVMLRAFVSDSGGVVVDEYVDDGYSGTNFDRPAVKRLLLDAQSGRIDTVVVKDLSRFGRNYIHVGQYIDYIFPTYGIRFIAVGDNIDTADRGSAAMDMLPIMNVFNEWHAANTSKKIRAVLDAKRRAGKYTGWSYPYGYRAGDDDKRTAVIDEDAAATVRRIYELRLRGLSAASIARILTDDGIPNPAAHYTRKDGGKQNRRCSEHWVPKTVLRILSDPTYKGSTVQHRSARISYKNKRVVNLPAEEWIVAENSHPPIVDEKVWNAVRQIGNDGAPRGRADKTHTVHPLSGVVACADCGKKLKYKRGSSGNGGFVCRTYTDLGKKYCSSHYVSERLLETIVLADIREMSVAAIDVPALKARFEKEVARRNEEARLADERNIKAWQNRLKELDKLIMSAFEDRVLECIPRAVCEELCKRYAAERETTEKNIAEATDRLEKHDCADAAALFVEKLTRFANCECLTRELCLRLIDRITVSEKHTSDGGRDIHIYYKFARGDGKSTEK